MAKQARQHFLYLLDKKRCLEAYLLMEWKAGHFLDSLKYRQTIFFLKAAHM